MMLNSSDSLSSFVFMFAHQFQLSFIALRVH